MLLRPPHARSGEDEWEAEQNPSCWPTSQALNKISNGKVPRQAWFQLDSADASNKPKNTEI